MATVRQLRKVNPTRIMRRRLRLVCPQRQLPVLRQLEVERSELTLARHMNLELVGTQL